MPPRAHVTSVEAIDAFRARLIVFTGKARACVEEVSDEIHRTQAWLENDRRTYWEREYRRRHQQLDEAEQELFNAKLSKVRTQTAAQSLAVERAKRSLRQAEEKRELVKRWSRDFEHRAQPLAKHVDQLLTFLSTDLTKATAYLGTVVQLLERYAAVPPMGSNGTPGASPNPVQDQTAEGRDQAGPVESPANPVEDRQP